MHIEHQPDQLRFVAGLESKQALLEYRLLPEGGIDFHHSFVPQEFRGKGIAEKLVKVGISWAKKEGYQMKASCSYVRRFLT